MSGLCVNRNQSCQQMPLQTYQQSRHLLPMLMVAVVQVRRQHERGTHHPQQRRRLVQVLGQTLLVVLASAVITLVLYTQRPHQQTQQIQRRQPQPQLSSVLLLVLRYQPRILSEHETRPEDRSHCLGCQRFELRWGRDVIPMGYA